MLTIQDTFQSSVVKLSQGNPGALRVCMELLSDADRGLLDLFNLDDMGITGPSIWLGYKDFARENIDTFRKALRDRDPEMVRVIKANGGQAWTGGRS